MFNLSIISYSEVLIDCIQSFFTKITCIIGTKNLKKSFYFLYYFLLKNPQKQGNLNKT